MPIATEAITPSAVAQIMNADGWHARFTDTSDADSADPAQSIVVPLVGWASLPAERLRSGAVRGLILSEDTRRVVLVHEDSDDFLGYFLVTPEDLAKQAEFREFASGRSGGRGRGRSAL